MIMTKANFDIAPGSLIGGADAGLNAPTEARR